MERAYRSLLETPAPVNRIAAELGFTAHASLASRGLQAHCFSTEKILKCPASII